MNHQILSEKQQEQYDALRELLQSCLILTERTSNTQASEILKERLTHLQSAALLVIVGEVKSGKSSFVNALLGEEVCEVAPDPCTAGIQELVYGDERTITNLGENWERLTLPKEVLRNITIVDTPGTNSIIKEHQAITEKYIPQSDIVLFVFPAKNPHTGSAWDFLSLVRKDWYRKMVFILQQSDLASPHELSINKERVSQYARERNVQNPVVFAVSAKLEEENNTDSGFDSFRKYLSKAIQTGDVWRMKVEGARDTAVKIAGRLEVQLREEKHAIDDDKTFYDRLLSKVKMRREKAEALRQMAVDSLCASYDRLANGLERDFEAGLGAGAVLKRSVPLLRDKDVKTWLKDLQQNFETATRKEIDAESARISKDIAEEMQSMFDELTGAINQRHHTTMGRLINTDPDRAEILQRLQKQLHDLRLSDIADHKDIESSGVGRLSIAGGGLAALGAVIAIASNMMIFDITGGILAFTGAGMIAVTLIWKRSGILRDFKRKMKQSRDEFRHRLNVEISSMFEKLFLETEHRLKEPLVLLNEKTERLEPLIEGAAFIREKSQKIKI